VTSELHVSDQPSAQPTAVLSSQTPRSRVVVVGQGYVGLPLAVRAAEVGHTVVGVDVDARRIADLNSGKSFIEDISSERLGSVAANGNYRATNDYAKVGVFDVAVITVPTPLKDSLPDLSFVEAAARSIGALVTPGCLVVLESTTYPGTTEEVLIPLLEAGSGLIAGQDFSVGFSPERIDPGNPKFSLENTPKVVSGMNETSCAAAVSFYSTVVDTVVPVSSCGVAELSKLIENTFRTINIALMNELAMYSHDLGLDLWEAIDAASTKPFGYMRFTPGPGVGGHCLPIDPSYLSWRVRQTLGQSFRFVELATDVNEHMPDYVVRRVMYALNQRGKSVSGSKILAFGLAYKANTSDARESPAIHVIERLVKLGAVVTSVDPFVPLKDRSIPNGVQHVLNGDDLVESADCVLMLTNHSAFDFAQIARKSAYALDTRRCLPKADGVEYL
jgi:UDP-N-acetyl-D-glucosamine dehydrogenase